MPLALAVGAVFVLAPIASAQTTNQGVHSTVATKSQRGTMEPLEIMKQSLNLSDEQARRLEPALKEQQDKLNALRRDASLSRKDRMAKLRELQQVTDSKIKAHLTPEQVEKWQKTRTSPGAFVQPQQINAARATASTPAPQLGATQPSAPTPSTAPQPPPRQPEAP